MKIAWWRSEEADRRRSPCDPMGGQVDDYEAIRQLLGRYAHAIDAADADGVASLFEPAGVFELLGDVLEGREAIAAMVRRFGAAGALGAGKHVTVNSVITVDGDRATARSDWLVVQPGPTAGWSVLAVGEYHDDPVRGDEWRFSRRCDLILGPIPTEAKRNEGH